MGRPWVLTALIVCVTLSTIAPSKAQDAVYAFEEYDKIIQSRDSAMQGGEKMFGDSINTYTGALEVIQVDVNIPGNNALPVRLARRFVAGRGYDNSGLGQFKYWDLDIPNLHGVYADNVQGKGWIVDNTTGINRFNRCSNLKAPPPVSRAAGSHTYLYKSNEFWQGSYFYLPGRGDKELLRINGANTHYPSDGLAYPVVTEAGDVARCLTDLAVTSEAGSKGQGFEVVTRDGNIYKFDHMVSRAYQSFHAPFAETSYASILPRREYFIFPTRVTDKFGNYVSYNWSTSNPWQLTSITSSDGRALSLSYLSADSPLVSSVSDGKSSWTYAYGATDTVIRPDGTRWEYDLGRLQKEDVVLEGGTCDKLGVLENSPVTGTIRSPSGATLTLTMAPKLFGRSWVVRNCNYQQFKTTNSYAVDPYAWYGLAVTQREITGTGLQSTGLIWSYSYGSPNNCWNPSYIATTPNPSDAVICDASSPTSRLVSVTNPDGEVTNYIYGNKFAVNEGLLLETQYGVSGSSSLRTIINTYGDGNAAPYAAYVGQSYQERGDRGAANQHRPLRQILIKQGADTFTWAVSSGCDGNPYCFDAYARPTKVSHSGSLGTSQSEH